VFCQGIFICIYFVYFENKAWLVKHHPVLSSQRQRKQGENKMDQKDNDRITEVIGNLIIGNMKAGSSYDTAKKQAFNRMNKEWPGVLNVWIAQNS
jgi:hypothetical protein